MSNTEIVQSNGAPPAKRTGAGPIETIRDLLERSKSKLADVLPKHLTPDRLMRVAIAAIARNKDLLACTPSSLLQSVMQAAQLGLEPGSALGEAYLVPYKTTCTLIIGYRGFIALARRSGQIQSIEAHVVHENDKFDCRYGMNAKLDHEPAWEGDPGAVRAVYAIARLKDGGTQLEVMTKNAVDAIRKRSKASGSGPWVTDYEEMARKTVVRRLAKYLPLSIELAEALAHEDEIEPLDVVDVPSGEEVSRTAALKAKLQAKSAPADEIDLAPEEEEPESAAPDTGQEPDAASQEASPADPPPASVPPPPAGGSASSDPSAEKAAAKQLVQEATAQPKDPKEEAAKLLVRIDEATSLSEVAKVNVLNEALPEPYRSENLKAAEEKRQAILAAKKGK